MPKKTMLRLDGSTLWLGGDSRRLTDEDRVVLGELRDRANAWNRRRGDAWLAEIGRELYGWLGSWATRLRAPNLWLDVVAADAVVREAPWELLHDGSGFLVDGGFEVVRRLEPAAPLPAAPPQHGLTRRRGLRFLSPRVHHRRRWGCAPLRPADLR